MMLDILKVMNEEQRNIYTKYKDEFPFKIVEFINDLGIHIFTSDMDNNISGSISKEDNRYIIYINDSHPPTRLKFTLAHELGHYFYDKDYLDRKQIIDPSKQAISNILWRKNIKPIDQNMREKDIKANQFAAELLMPEIKFIEIWTQETSPEKVAKFFGVSLEATKIRASTLLGEIF